MDKFIFKIYKIPKLEKAPLRSNQTKIDIEKK